MPSEKAPVALGKSMTLLFKGFECSFPPRRSENHGERKLTQSMPKGGTCSTAMKWLQIALSVLKFLEISSNNSSIKILYNLFRPA